MQPDRALLLRETEGYYLRVPLSLVVTLFLLLSCKSSLVLIIHWGFRNQAIKQQGWKELSKAILGQPRTAQSGRRVWGHLAVGDLRMARLPNR